jgi:hypothetical protein
VDLGEGVCEAAPPRPQPVEQDVREHLAALAFADRAVHLAAGTRRRIDLDTTSIALPALPCAEARAVLPGDGNSLEIRPTGPAAFSRLDAAAPDTDEREIYEGKD